MMQSLPDHRERQQALDVQQSFIVQAPAGSGKTELLTRRFLALLAEVNEPEQVLALTFTRKAAAEMRARIIHALQRAEQEENSDELLIIARRVLQKNQQRQWHLLAQTDRLQIMTLDAFNHQLVQRLPFDSRLLTYQISEQPALLYQRTVRQLLNDLDDKQAWQKQLQRLLIHCDNRWDKVERLLIDLLATRDQWLPYLQLAHQDIDALRPLLEAKLQDFFCASLKSFAENLSDVDRQLLWQCWQQAAEFAGDGRWQLVQDLSMWPSAELQYEKFWRALSDFLLTKEGQWRSAAGLRAEHGFPAPTKEKNSARKAIYQEHKNRMATLLEAFSRQENLLLALQSIQKFPPLEFTQTQWDICLSVLHLLPALLAYLAVEMQLNGELDHCEISLRALQSLGNLDEPTELALALDNKLQHILIDEFQDTSLTQYRLMLALTAGWQAGDGRSLFLVGDPQQSIYRFRKAEVGLFLRVWQEGLPHLPLTPLRIAVNFRSEKNLVAWLNESFANIFPKTADVAHGGVPLSEAFAIHEAQEEQAVQTLFYETEAMAHQSLIEILLMEKQRLSNASIAILVRSKKHLQNILPLLQAHQIDYEASDIEQLIHYPLVHDLLILSKALLRLDDRLSWLALLRTPWLNLSLNDIHYFAFNPTDLIYESLLAWQQQPNGMQQKISAHGQASLQRLLLVAAEIIPLRRRVSLSQLIYSAWLGLRGEQSSVSSQDNKMSELFFKTLQQFEQANDISDINLFERKLTNLTVPTNSPASVKIMTIHKAKGLEFDIVLVPCLERSSAIDDPALVLFEELLTTHNQEAWMMAPSKTASGEDEAHYGWLNKIRQKKADYEKQRLLYVACTRAKKRLYLIATYDGKNKPSRGSFLAELVLPQQ